MLPLPLLVLLLPLCPLGMVDADNDEGRAPIKKCAIYVVVVWGGVVRFSILSGCVFPQSLIIHTQATYLLATPRLLSWLLWLRRAFERVGPCPHAKARWRWRLVSRLLESVCR